MAEEWTIDEVRLVHATRIEVGPDGAPTEVVYDEWEIDLVTPAGRLTHFLPVDTVAWRLAEYGLDSDNLEHHAVALDMALHEPHIPQPEEPQSRATVVKRWASGGETGKASLSSPGAMPAARYDPAENLRAAPTIEDARARHLAQIDRAKTRVRITRASPDGVLADVRAKATHVLSTASAQPDPLEWILAHTADRLDAGDVARKRAAVEQARLLHANQRDS